MVYAEQKRGEASSGVKMDSIIIALITGLFSVLGVIITNVSSNRKIEGELQKNQAVTDTKIEELTREVREHNNFAVKIPLLEDRLLRLENRIEKL